MDYQKIYDNLIERAKIRTLLGYGENHHIIPRCLGGSDLSVNICRLTAREHYLAHALLCKIYPNNRSIIYAFHMMTVKTKNHQRKYDSKLYERMRYMMSISKTEEHKKNISRALKGRIITPEARQKLREANLGKKASEECKKKMWQTQKSRNRPKEEYDSRRGVARPESYKDHMKTKMKGVHKGKKKFNDGVKEFLCYPHEAKESWVVGRLKK